MQNKISNLILFDNKNAQHQSQTVLLSTLFSNIDPLATCLDKKKLRTVSCNKPISPENHIWMAGRITPNISGGISKTINLPNDCTADKIKEYFKFAWAIGCKCITVYRDGSKAIQPLSSVKKEKKDKKVCPICGSSNLSQSGTCGYCEDCGASTGCS